MASPFDVNRITALASGECPKGADGQKLFAVQEAGATSGTEGDDIMTTEGKPHPARFSPNAIHLIRTAQQAHIQLSAMADQKASILMGATFLIFTVAIGQARQSPAPLPLLILGGAAFFSAVLAVLSILPATHYRGLGSNNLLFFGSFTQLDEEEHANRLIERLESDEMIYRTMLHDLYQNGSVLERKKYRLLGYAYRVFLLGLSLSFVAFLVPYFVA
jgi:hypothetical protein